MKANEAFPSNFFKATDLEDDEELVLTIKGADLEKLGDDQRLACTFKGSDKKLIVNKTNFKAIVKATGEDDSDDWIGKRITLYRTETEFKGDTVECIRVRTKAPKSADAPPKKGAAASKQDKHPAGDDDDYLDDDGEPKF